MICSGGSEPKGWVSRNPSSRNPSRPPWYEYVLRYQMMGPILAPLPVVPTAWLGLHRRCPLYCDNWSH